MAGLSIGIVAGETSGDLLGAGLIREIRAQLPTAHFEGVAGPEMVAAGCEALAPAEALAVMGLIEPLKEVPKLLKLRRSLIQRWREDPPDVFVGIDAPDFNLGLEERLKRHGIRTVHYVSPSVWAWRQGRIRKIMRAADRVLCLLPFEKSFYDEHGVAATFVGHPMADRIPADLSPDGARDDLGLAAASVVAVLPGSRASEVSRLGPVFAATAAMLAENADLEFVAPMATPKLKGLFAGHIREAGVSERFTLIDGEAETAIASADVVLLASGTASLQAALLGRPMVAAYRLALLTYAIARGFKLVKVPYFTLPNLLTDEALVPEFLQHDANPENLAKAVQELLQDAPRRADISRKFSALREKLAANADVGAARAVLDVAAGN